MAAAFSQTRAGYWPAVLRTSRWRREAVFMVEQNATMALSIAHRGYVLQTGRLVLADTAANLLGHEELRRAYLGR
jgi:branched-chain amino acid transport system ATP-binding protein